ncbi:hypothetical protein [Streptomyces sp. NPDC005953]|uniref:hypothetical protein n=1 Tax=Streptomyces sp. NPDC005953 TaxID=3156719 RepID=UPI0033F9550F
MVRQVQITGTGQLVELSRRLKAAGGARLKANFARRIRKAAEPLHRDLQQTLRGLPITSQPRKAGNRGGASPTTRPLRATIAQAIRISVRTSSSFGARVWVDKDALPADLRNMASTINTGRIRHPVFGNRRRWAQQNATPLWWDKTVRTHTPRMTAEVARVLTDVRDQLS